MISSDRSFPLAGTDGLDLRLDVDAIEDDPARRVEDWIVSNLGDPSATTTAADSEWEELIGKIAPSLRRRSPQDREVEAGSGGWARFRVARRRGITVVAILDRAMVKEHDLDELAGDLVALIEAGHHRLVLNFLNVERISIRAVDALARAVRACGSAAGGALKFAGLRPEVAAVLSMVGLPAGAQASDDVASAIAGPWPESPDLRPLPVPILAALMGADRPGPGSPGASGSQESSVMLGVRLLACSEPFEGRVVEVDGPRMVIGRASGSALRLGFSTVSRHHAAIERREGRVELVDLGSTNGTWLNGRAIRGEPAALRDGDEVRIGPIRFVLSISPLAAKRAHGAADFAGRDLALPLVGNSPGKTALPSSLGPFLPDDLGEDAGLKLEVVEGVVIVTPRTSGLDDEATIDGLRETLSTMADRHGVRRVVVNLAHVGRVSGRAIGVLLAQHLKLGRDGGALRVCEACPRVAAILEGVHLGMLMECHPTLDDAVLADWSRGVADRLARG